MQSIYAMHQSGSDNLEKQEKFLQASIENILDLYLVMMSAIIELRNREINFIELSKNKHLATPEDKNPNLKFVSNPILISLSESNALSVAFENRKINNFQVNDDAILYLLQDVKESDLFINYMFKKESTFKEDRFFIADLFSEVIAPNDKFYSYLEDFKLTWVDDIPLVNTEILRQLKQIDNSEDDLVKLPKVYKDTEDKEFSITLFRKTILNEDKLSKEFIDKTPNWDIDRIAEVDTIIIKMAICEILNFPSIPIKVTLNEYLEIAKEYSTPKSSIFINGILDSLVKSFESEDRIKKIGRGLM
ncbi:transcription antitermination factor NusB [Flavobacterium sp.]|uniref:transcription antitermination factor NusB n=1 Tax=Flavobacterium sp. TaxID=239 RepID=UPI003753056B